MGQRRGGVVPNQSFLLWGGLFVLLFPWIALGEDSDRLTLQLVAGEKAPPKVELKVETVQTGNSHKKTRDEAISSLPLGKLPAPSQKMALAVVNSASLYRRLPTVRCQVDHRIYRFFADHPDVAVSLWRAMGVSKLEMFQTGEFEYEADAKDGTLGVITILWRSQEECLIHCSGMFQSPVLTKPIQARAILHVRTTFEVDKAGQQFVMHHADMFVTFPSQTVETIAKAMAPISHKITDKNFEEISLFVRMMHLAMTQQPGWVEQLAGKLDGILNGRSDSLLQLTAQCYIDEKKRLAQISGTPVSLETIRPPVAEVQPATVAK